MMKAGNKFCMVLAALPLQLHAADKFKAKKSPQDMRAEIQTFWGVGGDKKKLIAQQHICLLYSLHTSYLWCE